MRSFPTAERLCFSAILTAAAHMSTDSNPPLCGYIPTLDGWRAVAVGLVLLTHDGVHQMGRFSTGSIHTAHGRGQGGVELFFCISGILICTRLLEEERLTGTISLGNFYARRFFRIQPAAWVYLAFIAVLMASGAVVHAYDGIAYSLLMVRNYLPLRFSPRYWYTDHFWSLCVEEHFYLFLPLFLVVVRRRRIAMLLGLLFFLAVWARFVGNHPGLQFGWQFTLRTDFAAKQLVLSAAAAIALTVTEFRAWCRRWAVPALALPFAAAMFAFAAWHIGLGSALAALFAYPVLVVSTLLHPKCVVGRALEWAPVRFLGRISYSIYLWQMPFFTFYYPVAAPHARWLLLLSQTWLRYPAVLALSLMSYYWVEKPLVRLGYRLAKPPVPGRHDPTTES